MANLVLWGCKKKSMGLYVHLAVTVVMDKVSVCVECSLVKWHILDALFKALFTHCISPTFYIFIPSLRYSNWYNND